MWSYSILSLELSLKFYFAANQRMQPAAVCERQIYFHIGRSKPERMMTLMILTKRILPPTLKLLFVVQNTREVYEESLGLLRNISADKLWLGFFFFFMVVFYSILFYSLLSLAKRRRMLFCGAVCLATGWYGVWYGEAHLTQRATGPSDRIEIEISISTMQSAHSSSSGMCSNQA